MKKLIAFDMDGTLVKGGTWVKVHKHYKTLPIGDKNLLYYNSGLIDYKEFMRRDIASWIESRGKIHISEIENILSNFEIMPNAEFTIRELRKKGFITAVVSSGIDILAKKVSKRLNIDYVIANGLATDNDGYLTGEGIFGVDPYKKNLALEDLSNKLQIDLENTIAIGDSIYDKNFLKCAGLGIAYNPDEELKKIADIVIYDLKEVLDWI
ncbi:MAG: HAD family hydrolase, partial [Methanosarcinales archaeon]